MKNLNPLVKLVLLALWSLLMIVIAVSIFSN